MEHDIITEDQIETRKIEKRKVTIEYVKFLMTLSTGSIVVLATFLENITQNPHWAYMAALSLIFFMLSVLCGVIMYTFLVIFFPQNFPKAKVFIGLIMVLEWVFFVLAVASLVVFAVATIL